MVNLSYLRSINSSYIEELLRQYQQDPESVDESWRYFFDGVGLMSGMPNGNGSDGHVHAALANGNGHANGHAPIVTATSVTGTATAPRLDTGALATEYKIREVTRFLRESGHLYSQLDPLQLQKPQTPPSYAALGFTDGELTPQVRTTLDGLLKTYTHTVGIELAHLANPVAKQWLTDRLESPEFRSPIDNGSRAFVLKRLTEASIFEHFIHTRYVAQKRFSLEGGEALIPGLDAILETGAELGLEVTTLGMAHRGRLNVLHNICGKKAESIFSEFEDNYEADPLELMTGDVKYHKGYSAEYGTRQGKKVHLTLMFNPSHLEFVNAVVAGKARAVQELRGGEATSVLPIVIHGDAALAGQGICYEILNFSKVPSFDTAGTIHLVVNNQVGFTTDSADARSGRYCTDLARTLDVPIFHVNGDDAESLWKVSKLAIEYRQKFKTDVFIDIVCYRKYGHNEGDEPAFTQPQQVASIRAHRAPYEVFAERMGLSATETVDAVNAKLTEAQARVRAEKIKPSISSYEGEWASFRAATEADLFAKTNTTVPEPLLKEISTKLTSVPAGFNLNSKLARLLEARQKAVQEGSGIDWGNAESLAYGSLLLEGRNIRISGQDCERGTFTHRHAVFHDPGTNAIHIPLNQLADDQGRFYVKNSTLSESGVLGFEYGYALGKPKSLVIWEAQFGDFANGAQVLIDQFLASGEAKWQRANGLVLYLPHGYEGQGPEHSSARLERFLQLSGKNNWFVCNFTTPAQLFHAVRRHVLRPFRKPMIVMTPKSLLRHPEAVSTLAELSKGEFREVLDDPKIDPAGVRTVLLCSGKIYYELAAERAARKLNHVAILRVEQLYPWPGEQLVQILAKYPSNAQLVWVQEEPRNQGAWTFVFSQWMGGLDLLSSKMQSRAIYYVGRSASSSPAVGSPKLHALQQREIIEKALTV